MKALNQVANDLRKLADSVEALTKEQSTIEEVLQPHKEKPPSLEDVRKKLATLSQSGKQKEVKELITAFEAKKLSDIPVEKYPELLEKAGKL